MPVGTAPARGGEFRDTADHDVLYPSGQQQCPYMRHVQISRVHHKCGSNILDQAVVEQQLHHAAAYLEPIVLIVTSQDGDAFMMTAFKNVPLL